MTKDPYNDFRVKLHEILPKRYRDKIFTTAMCNLPVETSRTDLRTPKERINDWLFVAKRLRFIQKTPDVDAVKRAQDIHDRHKLLMPAEKLAFALLIFIAWHTPGCLVRSLVPRYYKQVVDIYAIAAAMGALALLFFAPFDPARNMGSDACLILAIYLLADLFSNLFIILLFRHSWEHSHSSNRSLVLLVFNFVELNALFAYIYLCCGLGTQRPITPGRLDALYFSAVTSTTVGYGDFSVQNEMGEIVAIFHVILSLGFLGVVVAFFVSRLGENFLTTSPSSPAKATDGGKPNHNGETGSAQAQQGGAQPKVASGATTDDKAPKTPTPIEAATQPVEPKEAPKVIPTFVVVASPKAIAVRRGLVLGAVLILLLAWHDGDLHWLKGQILPIWAKLVEIPPLTKKFPVVGAFTGTIGTDNSVAGNFSGMATEDDNATNAVIAPTSPDDRVAAEKAAADAKASADKAATAKVDAEKAAAEAKALLATPPLPPAPVSPVKKSNPTTPPRHRQATPPRTNSLRLPKPHD